MDTSPFRQTAHTYSSVQNFQHEKVEQVPRNIGERFRCADIFHRCSPFPTFRQTDRLAEENSPFQLTLKHVKKGGEGEFQKPPTLFTYITPVKT